MFLLLLLSSVPVCLGCSQSKGQGEQHTRHCTFGEWGSEESHLIALRIPEENPAANLKLVVFVRRREETEAFVGINVLL